MSSTATLEAIKPTGEETVAVWKREEDCTVKDRQVRLLQWAKCKLGFLFFLCFCRIIEPPTLDNPGGVIAFQQWPHILKAINALLTKKLIVWLKSRQIGASWLIAAYCLWFAMTHQGAMVLLFSKGETEAVELLAKCRRIYKNLPDFMHLKVNPDSATEMGFPTMMSTIRAFAATETAGISFTSSIIVCDEWEEHPYAQENYMASKPTRDAGGQFIGVFTVNKLKPDTLSKSIFIDAHEGKNDFAWLFDPWDVRPGRDDKWYEETKRNIPSRELGVLTPDLYMEQSYPASIEEALRSTQTVSAFNLKTLDEMMGDVKSPITVIRDGIDTNIVHIFKDFHIGEYFIAGTDTSHGVGKDFSVTVVMNVRTGDVVADIMNKNIPAEELALHSVRLLDIFKNPLWFIEANDWGGVTISAAESLNYRNFGYQDDKDRKIGFLTTEKNRPLLWGELIPGINNRQITIYNANGLKQFYDVIRNAEKGGRIEAMVGRHDDYPMAVGICWLKKGEVQTSDFSKLKPIETLTFASR